MGGLKSCNVFSQFVHFSFRILNITGFFNMYFIALFQLETLLFKWLNIL